MEGKMQKVTTRNNRQYETWYAFKRELELNLWCHIANDVWLEIKPKKALPWDDADLKKALTASFFN
jgi:hypothetical protein